MAQVDTRAGRFQTSIGGLVLASIVMAFFLGPLLRLANPIVLGVGGFLLGAGLFAEYQVAILTTLNPKLTWLGRGLGGLGLVVLIWAFSYALANSGDLDKECLRLQKTMLEGGKAQPYGRAHDAFGALGCRPQMARSAAPAEGHRGPHVS